MKYAMPVHPKVLEQDFETTVDLNKLDEIYLILKESKNIPFLTIGKYLDAAWFFINERRGINLRDREKLVPVFSELNKKIKGRKKVDKAYRGVRLSNFDPNALTRTYPDSIHDPVVLEHLESLAYGLRSWSTNEETGPIWAVENSSNPFNKDRVVFEITNPKVILDMNETDLFYTSLGNPGIAIGDPEEVALYIKNPKILSIRKTSYKTTDTYTVKIKDMG
jgi:hypothetical protein